MFIFDITCCRLFCIQRTLSPINVFPKVLEHVLQKISKFKCSGKCSPYDFSFWGTRKHAPQRTSRVHVSLVVLMSHFFSKAH